MPQTPSSSTSPVPSDSSAELNPSSPGSANRSIDSKSPRGWPSRLRSAPRGRSHSGRQTELLFPRRSWNRPSPPCRRGGGARQFEIELLRPHDPPVRKRILLSRPSRNPVNLFNLFRCALEELELPLRAPPRSRLRGKPPGTSPSVVRTEDDGFIALRISVPLLERVWDEQIALLEHERYAGQAELDQLIDRLRVRLGDDAVVRPELVESYIPEAAWKQATCSSFDHSN